MTVTSQVRQHWAALRALLVFTVILGIAYPLTIWVIAQLPGLHANADGSIIRVNGRPVASKLIGQPFTDTAGNPLKEYFQSRPSAAGDGYDPTASGGSNLGPESIVDTPTKQSLLTQICARSKAVGQLEHVSGARPFCTGDGVGAVLSVIGPRDSRGNVVHPGRVVSVNEPCATTKSPFMAIYDKIRVECAKTDEDYSIGQFVPVRGAASGEPVVPTDAVTASGSGLDPDISPAYAEIQVARVAAARHISSDQVRDAVRDNRHGRDLGFFGEPRVNVVALNLRLDKKYPVTS